ncbi:Pycsar system effector family protein [Hyphomicrobium sp.]|uniref:Pycsar system effector family protein n=1 Tax=Hyphomicrobium sp. TaxID=82 RepID=UPI00132BD420|nr:Pycsar system effector family protein [Hyphomicrobium sp.]KAB2939248.1 MAG: hypothetical protein F9K20_17880 [Hyphomicrobium sp.]
MLALLAVNATAKDATVWYLAVFSGLAVLALGVSIWFLYQASFPQLKGGNNSLVYFKEIAKRTEANYLKEMRSCDLDRLVDDMLGQVC